MRQLNIVLACRIQMPSRDFRPIENHARSLCLIRSRNRSIGSQERREAFRQQATPNVTVLHCRIPSESHRRLRHLGG